MRCYKNKRCGYLESSMDSVLRDSRSSSVAEDSRMVSVSFTKVALVYNKNNIRRIIFADIDFGHLYSLLVGLCGGTTLHVRGHKSDREEVCWQSKRLIFYVANCPDVYGRGRSGDIIIKGTKGWKIEDLDLASEALLRCYMNNYGAASVARLQ